MVISHAVHPLENKTLKVKDHCHVTSIRKCKGISLKNQLLLQESCTIHAVKTETLYYIILYDHADEVEHKQGSICH